MSTYFHDDQGDQAGRNENAAPEFGPGHAYRPRPTITETTGNWAMHTIWFADVDPVVGLDLMSNGAVRWRYKEGRR